MSEVPLWKGPRDATRPVPVVYLSLMGCTSCIVRSVRSRTFAFGTLSGRLKFTVQRDKFNKDFLSGKASPPYGGLRGFRAP